MGVFSETAYSSQTKLVGLNLPIEEHGIGYSNLTPDPQVTKSKNFPNKSCQALQRDDKNFISPSERARKTRKAGFLVMNYSINAEYKT